MRQVLTEDLNYLPSEIDMIEPQIAAVVIERGHLHSSLSLYYPYLPSAILFGGGCLEKENKLILMHISFIYLSVYLSMNSILPQQVWLVHRQVCQHHGGKRMLPEP